MTTATAPTRRRRTEADEQHSDRLWDLVDEIQADPDRADGPFGEFYRLTYGTVFRFAYARVGSRHDAEDLASEVYLRARRRIGRLVRTGSSPAAWLVTIARHLVADHYSHSWVRLVVPVADEGLDQVGRAYDRTVADARENQVAIALLGAVSRLTDDQREVVRLRYLLGQSIAVTAATLGKEEGAIKALAYRATRRLSRDSAVADLAGAWSRLAA